MRFRPLHLCQASALALLILCALAALLLSGCIQRTAEVGSIHLTIPRDVADAGLLRQITISQALYAADISVEQGKTFDTSAAVSAAVSAALDARDNIVSQGEATRSGGDSGSSQTGSAAESPASAQATTPAGIKEVSPVAVGDGGSPSTPPDPAPAGGVTGDSE